MKSKASYFNLNKNVFIEDMRRFWGISALYSIVLLFSSVFPILMTYSTLSEHGYFLINRILNNGNFLPFLFLTTAPLAAAVLIFRYLQNNNSTAVIHAFPFTRKELFVTHCISGIIIISLPVIINGLLLLLIKKPVYSTELVPVDIFTTAAILKWVGQSLLIAISGFSIAVFAGIISGTSLLQTIFGAGFLFLLPAIGTLLLFYFDHFFFGFNSGWKMSQLVINLSPITSILDHNDAQFSSGFIILYILLTIILLAASYILYMFRKLERSTDSIAFDFLKPLFKYSVSFCGMTVLGIYFIGLSENRIFGMYLGFIVGSLIAYIIAEMVVEKTIWVFKHLKGYLFFLIIAALFVTLIQTDITGYERRLPVFDKIESVYYGNFPSDDREFHTLMSEDNIESSLEFHQTIVDNRKWLERDPSSETYNITLNYLMKDGKVFTRQYTLPYEFFKHNPYVKKVYESAEYIKATNPIFHVQEKDLKIISLDSALLPDKSIQIINSFEIKEFCEVLKRDLLNESFEDMMSRKAPLARIEFFWKDNNELQEKYYYGPALKKSYANTLNWLEVKDYLDDITVYPEDIKYISIKRNSENSTTYPQETRSASNNLMIPTATTDLMVVTDKEAIQTILDNYENRHYHNSEGYLLTIGLNNGSTNNGFFQITTAPPFIINYFNTPMVSD